ncbi:asparaginase [uncultured Jatrophihabitans sp.]|uniref:asparaginase n=1 Tax=uncultured Jatrophihabitans sp. TaxID=1610747 RepID=UPI0035CB71C0
MTAPDAQLVVSTRGDVVESWHRGRVVVLHGERVLTLGDVHTPVYARSALKPLQATALAAAGFVPAPAELALAAASHSGEDVHLRGVRRILAGAGLVEADLQCPPALPSEPAALAAYLRSGATAAPVCHNCSGKHAAMVATCAGAGWPVGDYLLRDHPLQVAIAAEIERRTGAAIAATSVDGCGAPAHAVSLTALATAFASLAGAPADSAAGRVCAAMRAQPHLVGGTGRPVSELMAEVDGLVCKDGAEGVWAAALPDGRAFAAKVDDGASRALGPLLATVLEAWGFDGPAVRSWAAVPVLGGGRPVGDVRAAPQLRALLASA